MLSTGAFGMLICWKRLNFGGLWYICNLQSLPNMFGIFSSPYSPKKSASSICDKFAAMQKGLGVSGHLQLQTHFALMARETQHGRVMPFLTWHHHLRNKGTGVRVVLGWKMLQSLAVQVFQSLRQNFTIKSFKLKIWKRIKFVRFQRGFFECHVVSVQIRVSSPKSHGTQAWWSSGRPFTPGIESVIFPASLVTSPFSSQNAVAMCLLLFHRGTQVTLPWFLIRKNPLCR